MGNSCLRYDMILLIRPIKYVVLRMNLSFLCLFKSILPKNNNNFRSNEVLLELTVYSVNEIFVSDLFVICSHRI